MKTGNRSCLALAAMLLSSCALADAGDLRIGLAPYAWLSGVDGKVSVAGRSVKFDQSFSDLVSDVDMGFMGLGSVQYRRFLVFGQYDYVELGSNAKVQTDIGPVPIPAGTKVSGDLDTTITTLAAGYQFDMFGKHVVDVLAGYQDLSVKTRIGIGGNHVTEKAQLRDAVVMLAPAFRLGEKWEFRTLISYGVAGDSKSTYQLQPQLHYKLTPSLTAGLGYRTLHYEEDSGQKGTPAYVDLDIDMSGLILGVAWAFEK